MKNKFFAGIDIGGTKVSVCIGNDKGKIVAKKKFATEDFINPDDILINSYKEIQNLLKSLNLNETCITSIGVACPGPLDFKSGRTIFIPNIAGWENYPIVERLTNITGKRVFIENDANCAAIAERSFGHGRDFLNFVYITVSTGIGGGIIINGEIYHGSTCDAGEIGHMPILPDGPLCGCGKRGCLEALASGSAITKRAIEYATRYPNSNLAKHFKKTGENVQSLLRAVKDKDNYALNIWNNSVEYLAQGISNIIQILNPEAIIIGGGVSKSGKILFDNLRECVLHYSWERGANACKILPTTLGDDIVDIGTIALSLLNHSS